MVCNGWKQWWTVIRYARMSLRWFISWASMKCFQYFSVTKACWEASLLILYIHWVAYKYTIFKECLWIKSLCTKKFIMYSRKIKVPETVFGLFCLKKYWFPMKTIHPSFPLVRVNFCCLPGIFGKQSLKPFLFTLDDWQKSCNFFELGAWPTVKTCTCLIRFSALKILVHSPLSPA